MRAFFLVLVYSFCPLWLLSLGDLFFSDGRWKGSELGESGDGGDKGELGGVDGKKTVIVLYERRIYFRY